MCLCVFENELFLRSLFRSFLLSFVAARHLFGFKYRKYDGKYFRSETSPFIIVLLDLNYNARHITSVVAIDNGQRAARITQQHLICCVSVVES